MGEGLQPDENQTDLDKGAAEYADLGKERHMAETMDRLMTLAANAEKAGDTHVAEIFRQRAEAKGAKAGQEYEEKQSSEHTRLEERLEQTQQLLEEFIESPTSEITDIGGGTDGDEIDEQIRSRTYAWLGVTEARAAAEKVENYTATRRSPRGETYQEKGAAYVMPSEFGTVVELWSKNVNGGDIYRISIQPTAEHE